MRNQGSEAAVAGNWEPAVWDRTEYQAEYRARLIGSLELEAASRYWHMGWHDADTELLETARQRQRVEGGEEEGFRQTGLNLYHVGGLARIHGFHSMKFARVPGSKAGWMRTSTWVQWSTTINPPYPGRRWSLDLGAESA